MSLQSIVKFDNPQNFNFESGKIDFSGGKVWNGDYRTNRIFTAKFREDLNGRNSDNNTINPTTVGNVSIIYNRAFLADYDINKIDFAAADIGLGNLALKGTIRAVIMPNYSGNPTYPQFFLTICNDGNTENYITIFHWNNGVLFVTFFDNTGSKRIELTKVWNPVKNAEYWFELCWDLTQANVILFENGEPFLTYSGASIDRGSNISFFRIGNSYSGGNRSNFYIRDVAIFSEVQHTSSFTPDDKDAEYFELTGARLNKTADYSFLVNFKNHDTDELDADYAEGEKTGTGYNNPQIVNGELDLTHNDVRYVDYPYTGNIDGLTQGAIRIGIKPNYSNSPSSNQMFFGDNAGGSSIYCYQNTTGILLVKLKDIMSNPYDCFINWNPTQGEEYHFELNWNIFEHKFWFYINGQKVAEKTLSDSFFRALQGSYIRLGSNANATYTSNFSILYFSISKSILHDSSVTSFTNYDKTDEMAYPIQEAHYIEPKTKILTDGLESVGGEAIDTQDGDRRYIVIRGDEKFYWSGAGWVVSDGSWEQANDPVTMITNLPNFDLSDGYNCTFRVLLRSKTGLETDEIQNIVIDYNFYGGYSSDITPCNVWGYVFDVYNNPISDVKITIEFVDDGVNGNKIIFNPNPKVIYTRDTGYFEVSLIPNSKFNNQSYYFFTFEKDSYFKREKLQVPDVTDIEYAQITREEVSSEYFYNQNDFNLKEEIQSLKSLIIAFQ